MDLYRVHTITIRKADRDKADKILWKHYDDGDLDDLTIDVIVHKDRDGNPLITYRMKTYIYEDFKTIISEFKEAGIQIV